MTASRFSADMSTPESWRSRAESETTISSFWAGESSARDILLVSLCVCVFVLWEGGCVRLAVAALLAVLFLLPSSPSIATERLRRRARVCTAWKFYPRPGSPPRACPEGRVVLGRVELAEKRWGRSEKHAWCVVWEGVSGTEHDQMGPRSRAGRASFGPMHRSYEFLAIIEITHYVPIRTQRQRKVSIIVADELALCPC